MKVVTDPMRRAVKSKFGNLATVGILLALMASIGVAGLSLSMATVGHGGSYQSRGAPAMVAPSVGPVSAQVTITNAPAAYVLLPAAVTWSVNVTNGSIAPGSTWMSVGINDVTSSGRCVQRDNCPLVANLSATDLVASGVTSYSYTLTAANLTAGGYNGGVLPSDQFQIQVYVTINNTVSNSTFRAAIERFIVPAPPVGGFVAPLPGGALSTGNVTVGINYTGSYVNGATVTIYQGTDAKGALVYSQGVFVPGVGQHIVIANSVWYVSQPGSYFAVLNITTPYGYYLFTSAWTVVPAGLTVYQNASSYQNASIIPGLSPAVGGTVLLVVGLLVGMIVALALGRAMWGGAKPAAAQPWQAKSATNECSVCHQTFATEAELKEHSKSAHGM